MYPEHFGEDSRGSGAMGEREVYAALQQLPDDWTVLHNCWHIDKVQTDTNGEHYVNFEADFVVLVPLKGIVVIEVKNWSSAWIEQGVWCHQGIGGKAVRARYSPLQQAHLAARNLGELVFHGERLEYRAMAVLLNQDVGDLRVKDLEESEKASPQVLGTGLPALSLYICGRRQLQENLRERIENVFVDPSRQARMTMQTLNAIVQVLRPTLYLRVDPLLYRRQMDRAAELVHGILPMLDESTGDIRVQGCAGSGKTWMAQREAMRHVADGERVLFLCYNIFLAEYLRQSEEAAMFIAEGLLVVEPFLELCRRVVGREVYPEMMGTAEAVQKAGAEVLAALPPDMKFDTIIIDEAQDFRAEWEPVVRALSNGHGRFYLFSDSNQNLFQQNTGQGFFADVPTRLTLRRNIRNSTPIARYASGMLPQGSTDSSLDLPGRRVEVEHAIPSVSARARKIAEWVQRLSRGERNWAPMTPHSIVVLSPHTPYKRDGAISPYCCLPELAHIPGLTVLMKSADCNAEQLADAWAADPTALLGTTVRSFKGMEADCIILTDVDVPGRENAFTSADCYVACTRAKYALIIIPRTPDAEQYFKSKAQATPPHPPKEIDGGANH